MINIITKSGETAEGFSGAVIGSYGKSSSQDYRAELRGNAKGVGYYLFAGHQESDGLVSTRGFDNNSLYGKLTFAVSRETELGVSVGYSEPHNDFGEYPAYDITQTLDTRTFFANAFLNTKLTQNIDASLSFHTLKVKYVDTSLTLGLGIYGDAAGELFSEALYDDQYSGGEGRLVWKGENHTVVLGADMEHLSMDLTTRSGVLYQDMGVPKILHVAPDVNRWAIYLNDTITWGNWSLTPGVRYDHNDVSGSFVSPSLGLTYKLGEASVLRAAVAKGFSTPHVEALSGGGRWLEANPSLNPEEVWSYQAGFESGVAKHVWVKASYFHHDMENALYRDRREGPPNKAV